MLLVVLAAAYAYTRREVAIEWLERMTIRRAVDGSDGRVSQEESESEGESGDESGGESEAESGAESGEGSGEESEAGSQEAPAKMEHPDQDARSLKGADKRGCVGRAGGSAKPAKISEVSSRGDQRLQDARSSTRRNKAGREKKAASRLEAEEEEARRPIKQKKNKAKKGKD